MGNPQDQRCLNQMSSSRAFVLISTVLVLFGFSLSPYASAEPSSPPWKRLHHLQKGINLSDWLTESNHLSVQQLRTYVTPGDIDHIHQLGFDHIRIPVGPDLFKCEGSWDSCEQIQVLDQVIQKALALDLDVIVDFHPSGIYTHQLVVSEAAVTSFLRLWAQIADRYAHIDPDRIILEVMNEFNIDDHYRWSGILQEAVRVIRLHAPLSTIIVSAAMYADIWDLVRLPVVPDDNIIYNFHYYEPHMFTHQGASWSSGAWRNLHNVPFPPTTSNIAPVMDREEDDYVRWMLLQYVEEHWDTSHIEADIGFAAQWAKKRNVPLLCDEFGSYRNYTSPEDRERWITAVRSTFEKFHIGWSMWDYQGGFGIVYKQNGKTIDDDVALRGLGMKK